MPTKESHLRLLDEKIDGMLNEYAVGRTTNVGELAIKAVEQMIEFHAAKEFGRDLGDHEPRINFAKRRYEDKIVRMIFELFSIYGALGYEGRNGVKAKRALHLVKNVAEYISAKVGEDLWKSRKLP